MRPVRVIYRIGLPPSPVDEPDQSNGRPRGFIPRARLFLIIFRRPSLNYSDERQYPSCATVFACFPALATGAGA